MAKPDISWLPLLRIIVTVILVLVAVCIKDWPCGYFFRQFRTPGTRFETKSFKLVVSGIYGFLFVVASGIYLWYAIPTAQTTPDAECKTFIRAPVDDPITNNYRFLGWLLAFAPVILGLILGIPFLLRLTWPDRIGFFQLLFSGTNSLEERKKRKTKEDIALERIHGPDDPGTYLLHDPRDRWN
ncbi:unnamed protein product [Calicophoron daubneyi]|uniref:Transmembrane protein n=1 Tax=Calicophoron daubneyi TaxID=300641 RepID=A0AAV2T564_CALDB